MPDIDNLSIKIKADSDTANKALTDLISNLNKMTSALQSVGKNINFGDITKNANALSQSMGNIQKNIGNMAKNAENQLSSVSKAFSGLEKNFDIGKNINPDVFNDLKMGSQSVADSMRNAVQSISGLSDAAENSLQKQINSFEKQNAAYKNQALKIDELKGKIEQLSNIKVETPEFKQISNDIEKTQAQINKLVEAQKLFLEAGGKDSSSAYKKREIQIKELRRAIDFYKSDLEDLKTSGEAFTQVDTSKLTQKLGSEVEKLELMGKSLQTTFEGVSQKVNNVLTQGTDSDKLKKLHETLQQLKVPDVLETDINKLNANFDKTKQKLEGLKVEFQNALTMGKITESPDDKGYVKFRETIAKTGMELSALSERIKEVNTQNRNLDLEKNAQFIENLQNLRIAPIRENDLDKLTSSLEKAEQKVEELYTKLENGITMGRITASIDDSSFVRMNEEIALAEMRVVALNARIAEVRAPSYTTFFDSIKQFPHMVADVFKNIPYLATKGIGVALKGAANIGIKGFQTLGKVGMSALKGIGNLAGKIGSKFASMINPFKKLVSASQGLGNSFGGGFTNLLKYAFGIRSLFTLFNKLRNAVKEGMKNLVQYSDETNASVSMLTNSMTQLKNSVAAAVSPLLNALAPALDFIIQLCVKAVNAINQLISALLGKATWIHAKKLTDSYRDSLNGVSKAAEKVQKGVRAFDELNVITTPDDNDSGSGAGTSAADMFETLDVEKPFSDLAERIKEMWEKADFTELGTMVGGKIKAGLESIDWGTIQGNVAKVSKSLATFINGLVEVEGLGYTVGTSIGEGFNTALIAVNTFLDNTHWDSIGTFIGEGLNGIVDTVDWGGIGHMFAQKWNALFETLANTVSTFDWSNLGKNLSDSFVTFIEDLDTSYIGESISGIIKGLLDTIIAFVENTDWKKLGNTVADKIGDFVNSIDWSGIADRLFEAIGAVLGGLAAFLWGLIEDAWQNVVDWWYDTAYEDGEFTMKGLLEGIWNKIKDIGTWIKEHIFQPFIDGFKKAFGIASPSKVMEEQGNFIMEGLFNGISSLVDKVVGIFGDIKTKISEKWNEIKTNTVQIWENIKTWISETWNNIKTSIFSSIENVKSFVSNAWENIRNVTSNIWGGIRDTISNVAQSISNIVGGIFDKIGQVKDKISDFTNSIKSIDISAPSFITGGISSIFSGKVKGYASGGFIENPHSYSLFMAGENGIPEMLGTVGGQPAVAGGQEITGISDTIRSETERQNELLRQEVQLLQELLRKDFGITKDEIGQAARDYSREYFDKNGKPAFAY